MYLPSEFIQQLKTPMLIRGFTPQCHQAVFSVLAKFIFNKSSLRSPPPPITMLLRTTGYKRQSGGGREGAIDLAGAATPLMALSHPFSGVSSRSYDDLEIENYSENLR